MKKSKIVLAVVLIMLLLGLVVTSLNYTNTLRLAKEEIIERSIPLSLSNIYTSIQKNIIEPYIVSSFMANDTFVKNWIENDQNQTEKIAYYLRNFKEYYHLYGTFLVTADTKKYYTDKGYLETLSEDEKDHRWYFRFLKEAKIKEINIDSNKKIDPSSMLVFINHKIFDTHKHLLGVTGTIYHFEDLDKMIANFKRDYLLNVSILTEEGKSILSHSKRDSIDDFGVFIQRHKAEILSPQSITRSYYENGDEYILTTRYIPELGLHIIVQSNLDQYTKELRGSLRTILASSFLAIVLVLLLLVYIIRKNEKKLEKIATSDTLTMLPNRRAFLENLQTLLKIAQRTHAPINILFLDVDNFKQINDHYGHSVGDEVLQRLSTLLQKKTRETNMVARWGGEEFVLLWYDMNPHLAFEKAKRLCKWIERDSVLFALLKKEVTMSCGLTVAHEGEPVESILQRADALMYEAKKRGKNQVVQG